MERAGGAETGDSRVVLSCIGITVGWEVPDMLLLSRIN